MVEMPNRDRKAERREATRAEILAAAWEVAEAHGIAGLTLKEVAVRVGMKPPSLYSHFASKAAIYDAMFASAWTEYADAVHARLPSLPEQPRRALLLMGEHFFDFATSSPARHQLMNLPVVPGFEPTADAYAPAVQILQDLRSRLRELGVVGDEGLDLLTALLGGLVNQQLANDPGGTRWRQLLPRAITMYADEMGLPPDPQET